VAQSRISLPAAHGHKELEIRSVRIIGAEVIAVPASTDHNRHWGAWAWAIAVSILPLVPFALAYGIYGLSLVAQAALLLFLARSWIRPDHPARNVATVSLLSAVNGAPVFLIWDRLQFCSGVCLRDSVPGFLGMFALLGGLMLVALLPLTWFPRASRTTKPG
jgi:hypothetical protein